MPIPPRPSPSFAETERDRTPSEVLRPFLVSKDLAERLRKDPVGADMLDLVSRLSISTNTSQQKIWNALRSNDTKIDLNNKLCQDILRSVEEVKVSFREALIEERDKEALQRRQADEEMAEYIGRVFRDLSRNSSADLERDMRVQQVEVVSQTALTAAEDARTKAMVPLSGHAKRQVGILGAITGFFTVLVNFRDPILGYMRLRGWIP